MLSEVPDEVTSEQGTPRYATFARTTPYVYAGALSSLWRRETQRAVGTWHKQRTTTAPLVPPNYYRIWRSSTYSNKQSNKIELTIENSKKYEKIKKQKGRRHRELTFVCTPMLLVAQNIYHVQYQNEHYRRGWPADWLGRGVNTTRAPDP